MVEPNGNAEGKKKPRQGPPDPHPFPLDTNTKEAVIQTFFQMVEEEKLSPLEIKHRLSTFEKKLKKFPTSDLYATYDSNILIIRAYLIEDLIKTRDTKNDKLLKSLYLYFTEEYHTPFLRRKKSIETMSKENFVIAAKNLINPFEPLEWTRIELYKGKYKLYRPYHLDPLNKIAVCLFEIGSAESIFDCSFTTKFFDEQGTEKTHTSTGKLIIHGADQKRFSAITAHPLTGPSVFMFHFDYVDLDEGHIDKMGGLLISSYGSDPSSAWPIFAIKAVPNEIWSPEVIDKSQIDQLHPKIKNRLNRGAVYWRAEHFPKPSIFG